MHVSVRRSSFAHCVKHGSEKSGHTGVGKASNVGGAASEEGGVPSKGTEVSETLPSWPASLESPATTPPHADASTAAPTARRRAAERARSVRSVRFHARRARAATTARTPLACDDEGMRCALVATMAIFASALACTGALGDADGDGSDGGAKDAISNGDSGGGDSTSNATDSGTSGADTTPPPPVDSGTPPPDDTGTTVVDTGPPSDPVAAARVTCVDEINKYRATLSLPPYAPWTSAETCVDGQAKKDSETGTAHSAFGTCGESAQNECPGWPGPPDSMIKSCLAMMWAEGPGSDFSTHGHYLNMSNSSFTAVACGFYQTPAGDWWAAQDFR